MSIEAGDIVRTPYDGDRIGGQPSGAHNTLGVVVRDQEDRAEVLPIQPDVPHTASSKKCDLGGAIGWIWHKEDLEVVESAYGEDG